MLGYTFFRKERHVHLGQGHKTGTGQGLTGGPAYVIPGLP